MGSKECGNDKSDFFISPDESDTGEETWSSPFASPGRVQCAMICGHLTFVDFSIKVR